MTTIYRSKESCLETGTKVLVDEVVPGKAKDPIWERLASFMFDVLYYIF